MTWLFVMFALAGYWFNIRRDWRGFALWLVSNAGLAIVNFINHSPAEGVLFTVYLLMSVVGLRSWKRESRRFSLKLRHYYAENNT